MVSGDSFEMQMYIQGQNNVKLNTVIIQLVRACTIQKYKKKLNQKLMIFSHMAWPYQAGQIQ